MYFHVNLLSALPNDWQNYNILCMDESPYLKLFLIGNTLLQITDFVHNVLFFYSRGNLLILFVINTLHLAIEINSSLALKMWQ